MSEKQGGLSQASRGIAAGTADDWSEPVPVAQVRLRDMGRSELSHSDGSFHFDRIPAANYTSARGADRLRPPNRG